MKSTFTLILLFTYLKLLAISPNDVVVVVPDENGIVYVNSGSTGNGSSWSNAVGELAEAMEDAKTNNEIHEIWVTTGTYNPLYNGYDDVRKNFFPGRSNLRVYGGFSGTETSIDDRILTDDSLSILNGNLDNNLRSYSLLVCDGIENFILDGFIITGAYSSYNSEDNLDGAIHLDNSDVTIKNCIITQNHSWEGAGILGKDGSTLILKDSKLKINVSEFVGGAINFSTAGNLTIDHCEIINNSSGDGHSIYTESPLNLRNSIIYDSSGSLTWGIYLYNSFELINVTVISKVYVISENTDRNIKNSVLVKGLTPNQGIPLPNYYNTYVSSQTQEDENNNLEGTLNPQLFFMDYYGEDFRLSPYSPLINKGNNTYNQSSTDLDGHTRIFDEVIDIGAYEYQDALALTYVPDDNFEQALISLGYDDNLDDHIIMANIVGINNLDVSSSNISDLTGIEDFLSLENLDCSNNQISQLDLSQNQSLNYINCSHNSIIELNSANAIEIYCSYNQLTSLELLGYFTKLYCDNNQLESLNIRNGMNTEIQELKTQNNPNLTCIQVDDSSYSEENWTNFELFQFDEWTNFSEDCENMSTTNNDFNLLSIYPNPTDDLLNIKSDEEILKFEVFDINGRIYPNLKIQNNTIDVKSLSSGTYILKIYLENSTKRMKFIKK